MVSPGAAVVGAVMVTPEPSVSLNVIGLATPSISRTWHAVVKATLVVSGAAEAIPPPAIENRPPASTETVAIAEPRNSFEFIEETWFLLTVFTTRIRGCRGYRGSRCQARARKVRRR